MMSTAVIKRDDPRHRSIGQPIVMDVLLPPEPDPLALECASLAERCADLEVRLAAAVADGAARVEAARADGRASGLAAADRREDERLATLAAGLADQRDAIDVRLQSLDQLAAALARTALARMFADGEVMADRVAATIARHVAVLRRNAVVRIVVSRQDFAAPDVVAEACGPDVAIEISDALPSGACRAQCRLGGIDLDVPNQWSCIAAELDAMAGEGS